MPTNTPNLNLIKPLVSEHYDVVVANANNDILDTEVASKAPKANPVFTGTQTLPNIVTNGIKFPATQVPSADPNTLDDYEKGEFTPNIYGTVTAGVGTYTSRRGYYTKIGNICHVSIYVAWTNHTGSGALRFNGLPFKSNSPVEAKAIVTGDTNYTSGGFRVGGIFENSYDAFLDIHSTTTGGYLASVNVSTSGSFIFNCTYKSV